jgi:hypothetical protein
MTQAEFWNSTIRQVLDITTARVEAHQERERGEWERARWLGTVILQPHLQKGKTLKPTDLIKFDWEQRVISEQRLDDKESEEVKRFWANKWDQQMMEQWQ